MPWQEVISGNPFDVVKLYEAEENLPEGSHNLLNLALRLPVTEGVAQTLEDMLKTAGVQDVRVTTASPVLKIYWTKGIAWTPIIIAALITLGIFFILVITWVLSTKVPEALPWLALAGIAAATVFGIYLVKRKGKT